MDLKSKFSCNFLLNKYYFFNIFAYNNITFGFLKMLVSKNGFTSIVGCLPRRRQRCILSRILHILVLLFSEIAENQQKLP